MPMPLPHAADPGDTLDLIRAAFALANQAVISDIESEARQTQRDGFIWWDTRPMTDLREHSPICVDMSHAAIEYAVCTGLALAHPVQPYLLRFEPARTLHKKHQLPADPRRPNSLLRLALDILDPEAFGHAVTAEVRAAARQALGVPA